MEEGKLKVDFVAAHKNGAPTTGQVEKAEPTNSQESIQHPEAPIPPAITEICST